MSGNVTGGSTVWFVCFFCKRAYKQEILLKKHKFEVHRHLMKILKKRNKRINRHHQNEKIKEDKLIKRKTLENASNQNVKEDEIVAHECTEIVSNKDEPENIGNSNNECSNNNDNANKNNIIMSTAEVEQNNIESDLKNNGNQSSSPDYNSNLIPDSLVAVAVNPKCSTQLAKKRGRKTLKSRGKKSNALIEVHDEEMLQPVQQQQSLTVAILQGPEKKAKGGRSKKSTQSNKPFSCSFPDCPTKFSSKQTKRRHENLHINPTPFHCDACDSGFARKEYLRKHVQNVHPGTNQNDDISQV